jgi:hypothetical protein
VSAVRARIGPVLAVVLMLTACTGGRGGAPSGAASSSASASTPAPSGTPVPAPSPAPAPPATCDPAGAVEVGTAAELTAALAAAAPGRTIHLADGTYRGNFVATAQGSADQPVTLCGGRGAVLDGGDVDGGGYTLHLDGAAHWRVLGLTLTGGQKGLMVDAGAGNLVEGLLVRSVGDEAIHLRTGSTDNVVRGNTVRETGLRREKFGEGVYVGSAESNWAKITDGQPDRSDRNLVEGNDIAGTTAESVDVKEGTNDGVVRGNRFDGGGMTDGDSWVDVKGNGWLIEGNVGTASPEDGFQVHEVVDGWGRDNVFRGNTAQVDGPGYGINAAGPREMRDSTVVACDNTAPGAASGLTNVDCRS